jgi:hypothetical protein
LILYLHFIISHPLTRPYDKKSVLFYAFFFIP